MQPIRTFGEITTRIKILPARQSYLYQKLSKKATQLRLLGMSYGEIAKSLHVNRKTATKAANIKGSEPKKVPLDSTQDFIQDILLQ